MTALFEQIEERLFLYADELYKTFQSSLIPNLPKERIIGVRTPIIRKLASEMKRMGSSMEYLETAVLPFSYYEEDNLFALLLAQIPDYETCCMYTNRFLPFLDNWATCDMLHPPAFMLCPNEYLSEIARWLESDHIYTVRFGLAQLMHHFLIPNRFIKVSDSLSMALQTAEHSVVRDAYYVQMMLAWFFAEALILQYEEALPYLTERKLPDWIHRKTIQKARESRRLSPEQKAFLLTLK